MGKRWIDVWFLFINLNFEMRFDNFTRATFSTKRLNRKFKVSTKSVYKIQVARVKLSDLISNSNL